MNRRSILTKTGKGLMEATGKTSHLPRDLRNVLKEIDGKVSVSALLERLDRFTEPKLVEALIGLERDGYVREFIGSQDSGANTPLGRSPLSQPLSQPSSDPVDDLDFTVIIPAKPAAKEDSQRAQSQEMARLAQAARVRAEAAAKAQAAERARAEAGARAKIAADPKATLDLQAKLQTQALDQARREAEERQRRDAEEKARLEMEARARFEAEDRAKREAEERQRLEFQEKTRREEGEKARRDAEARARRETEEGARKEAEERARRQIEEQVRRETEERKIREEVERRSKVEAERARREAEEMERRRREEREHTERMARIDAEARAKVEAQERMRREQEEMVKRELEDRAKREEELRFRTGDEARKRKEAQDREVQERAARERREAQEREVREREARQRQETQEREARERQKREDEAARSEIEEKIRQEEQRESKERDERARRQAEKAAAEEKARLEEEAENRAPEDAAGGTKEAEEEERKAREEERSRAREEARARKAERSRERAGEEAWRGEDEARERAPARTPADWTRKKSGGLGKQLSLMLLIILIIGVAVLPFVPLESGPYEKAAQEWLGVPVKIGSTSVSLLPSPQLKFEKVVIGEDPPLRVASIGAVPDLGSLTDDRKVFRSLELTGVAFSPKYLPVLLSDKGRGNLLRVEHIIAKGVKLGIPELELPPLDVNARLGADGTVKSVVLANAERKLSVILLPQGRRASIEVSADSFPLPIGGDLVLGEFSAKGTLTSGEMALTEVEGRAFGGRVLGNARLRWSSEGWSLDGELGAKQIEAAKLAAPILGGGVLEGKGVYAMKAAGLGKLFASARFEGNFSVAKGSINNVDMTRVLQGSSTGGGTTLFSEMSGVVTADPSRMVVRQLRLVAGLLNGTGQAEMDSQKNLSGRMQIELRSQTVQARATLSLTGRLKDPQFRRSN